MNSSNEPGESELERKARALFEDSVERLDARTRSKLTQARNRALDEVKNGAVRRRWIWAPAGGVALAAIVAVVMLQTGGVRSGADTGRPLQDRLLAVDGVYHPAAGSGRPRSGTTSPL